MERDERTHYDLIEIILENPFISNAAEILEILHITGYDTLNALAITPRRVLITETLLSSRIVDQLIRTARVMLTISFQNHKSGTKPA